MGFGIMFIMIQNPSPDPVGTKRDAFRVGLGIFLALQVLLGGDDKRAQRNGNNDERPSPRGFETKFVATPLQSSSHENWHGG